MSATRLLVLGVVRMYGRAHGYQVRRELLSWSADKWADVQPGSIHHALNLLEQIDVEPGDGGRTGSPTGSPTSASRSTGSCCRRRCPTRSSPRR